MGWLWIIGTGWLLLAVAAAPMIGRSIALADHREAGCSAAAPAGPRCCVGAPARRTCLHRVEALAGVSPVVPARSAPASPE